MTDDEGGPWRRYLRIGKRRFVVDTAPWEQLRWYDKALWTGAVVGLVVLIVVLIRVFVGLVGTL